MKQVTVFFKVGRPFERSIVKDVSSISYDKTFIRIEGKRTEDDKASPEFAVFLTEEVLYFQQEIVES